MHRLRAYRLRVELGLGGDVDGTSAVALDWDLAIHDVLRKIEADRAK